MKKEEVFKKKNILSGILAGLIAGFLLGLMMLRMEMMSTIGALMGMPNVISGFAFHLIFCAIFGLIFALVFYRKAKDFYTSALWGGIYGIFWWLIGTLTIAPLLLGQPVTWDAGALTRNMSMLMGQIVFGVVLGICYHWLRSRLRR